MIKDKMDHFGTYKGKNTSIQQKIAMSSSVPYDPYIPNQTTGEQSASRTAAIQAVCDDQISR